MLRFVQGIHKAFRSNQAYAPCQKAAHDQDEFETRPCDGVTQPRKSYEGFPTNIPVSQSLPSCLVSDIAATVTDLSPSRPDEYVVPHNRKESHSHGSTLPHGLLPGALFGAGYAVFNSLHGFCSGRGGGKDRTQYCPVRQYQTLQRSSVVVRALTNLLPGSYDTSPGFNVLPKSSVQRCLENKENVPCMEESTDDSGKSLCQKEFEKSQAEVNSLADVLCNVDKDHLAADHFRAMQAWKGKDFASAAVLWQRTVDKFATPMAAHRLGICYEHGHGVQQNYQQAAEYYRLAISHKCSRAMYRQALLQMKGLVNGQVDSMELMKQAAELNCAQAQTFLGSLHHRNGKQRKAVEYYEKAAAQKDPEACYYLGICHETGAGVPCADDNQAAIYYTKAAEGGHADAQYNLSIFHEEGYGDLLPDQEKAIHWLKKSANQGNSLAKDRLQQLGQLTLVPSVSLPAIGRHLPSALSDLAVPEIMRAYSDNSLAKKRAQVHVKVNKAVSRASSASSIAGTPQFYIPAEGDDDDVSTFGDWSDEGLSTASSSSLRLDQNQLDEFSIDFSMEKMSYNPMYNQRGVWPVISPAGLRAPANDGPQVMFA